MNPIGGKMLKYYEDDYIDPNNLIENQFFTSVLKTSPEHNHDHYEFFLITDGQCNHIVNNNSQFLEVGDFVLIRPNDTHRYELLNDMDCKFLNISCRNELIKDAFAYLSEFDYINELNTSPLPKIAKLSLSQKEELLASMEHFKMLSTIDIKRARIFIKGLFIELLTKHFLYAQEVQKKNLPFWFENLLSKMQKKENFCIGLDALNSLSGRSQGHLNRVFRQHLGLTPTEYINQIRLSYAKNLILTSETAIVEIAFESGFENLSHFYHQFKKHYHQTPMDLRKRR